MAIYAQCLGCALLYLFISYILGKAFLSLLKIEDTLCDSILFGFLILSVLFQLTYLPFFLLRGSYRTVCCIWLIVTCCLTILSVFHMLRSRQTFTPSLTRKQWLSVSVVSVLILSLSAFVVIHTPIYGMDFRAYNAEMNNLYYRDVMWLDSETGVLDLRRGVNSFFALMTVPSVIFGIRPYYIDVFMNRSLLIFLFSMIVYRTGTIVLSENHMSVSSGALGMSIFVPVLLLLWKSAYHPEFYYYRANEAKAYCQFLLLSLAFSVFLQMFQRNPNRKALWILQSLIGLSALAISMSSLSTYPFLVFAGTIALLAYDRLHGWSETCLWSLFCMAPNLLYAVFYYLSNEGYIVL